LRRRRWDHKHEPGRNGRGVPYIMSLVGAEVIYVTEARAGFRAWATEPVISERDDAALARYFGEIAEAPVLASWIGAIGITCIEPSAPRTISNTGPGV
jgi:hypothetical protein